MNEIPGRVLDYLGYKNKIRTAEWAERIWRQHLEGAFQDIRAEADRDRYGNLVARIERSRQLARSLHLRRNAHAPRFGHAPTALAG